MSKNAAGIRSLHGCWTCRLRRKKCDETQPACNNCNRLQLDCLYGPRPPWMDRGALERDAAIAIKSKILANGNKKAKVSLPSAPANISSTPPFLISLDNISPLSTVRSSSDHQDSLDTNPSSTSLEIQDAAATSAMSGSPESQAQRRPSIWSNNSEFVREPIIDDCTANMTAWASGSTSSSSIFTSPSAILQVDDWQELTDETHFSNEPNTLEALGNGDVSLQAMDSYEACHGTITTSLSTYNNLDGELWHSSVSTNQGIFSVNDALIISYYLENVMPLQFPHCNERAGWMQFLLHTSRCVQEATLILTKAIIHHSTVKDSANSNSFIDVRAPTSSVFSQLAIPVASLSALSQEKRAEQVVTHVASLLQLIHLEAHVTASSRWHEYMKQIAPYAQTLVDLSMLASGESSAASFPQKPMKVYIAAAQTIIGVLSWLDIINAVSSGSDCFLGINYLSLLSSNVVDMSKVSGCPNTVVKEITEVLLLRKWKLQAEKAKALNVMELAVQGHRILQTLEDIISRLESVDEVDYIGLAFARAAVIYLHTVISGPNPNLHDIRCQVTQLRLLLRRLAQAQKLDAVIWPVCVATCFGTSGDEEPFSSALVQEADGIASSPSKHWRSRVLSQALERGQQCCSIRDADGKDIDWTLSGMDVSQEAVLLL